MFAKLKTLFTFVAIIANNNIEKYETIQTGNKADHGFGQGDESACCSIRLLGVHNKKVDKQQRAGQSFDYKICPENYQRTDLSQGVGNLNAINRSLMSPYLTKKEAAEYLRISIRTIERWIHQGRISYSRPSRDIIIQKDELDRVVKESTVLSSEDIESQAHQRL